MLRLVKEFYRQPFAWLLLAVCDVTLVYGGGAAMFWYHSYLLGEGGPAISPYLHWFIDSTVGLIGLTPVLFMILPIAARAAWDAAPAHPHEGAEELMKGSVRPISFMAIGGILFALATAPGPIVHDNLVGRGTWLADQITELWGDDRPLSPNHHYTPITSVLTQEAFGLPLYPAILGALLLLGTFLMKAANRRSAALDEEIQELNADRTGVSRS